METTILFGNGVNRLSDNGIEGKELLKKVSGMLSEMTPLFRSKIKRITIWRMFYLLKQRPCMPV